jgi:hypothetical protein
MANSLYNPLTFSSAPTVLISLKHPATIQIILSCHLKPFCYGIIPPKTLSCSKPQRAPNSILTSPFHQSMEQHFQLVPSSLLLHSFFFFQCYFRPPHCQCTYSLSKSTNACSYYLHHFNFINIRSYSYS